MRGELRSWSGAATAASAEVIEQSQKEFSSFAGTIDSAGNAYYNNASEFRSGRGTLNRASIFSSSRASVTIQEKNLRMIIDSVLFLERR